MSQTILITGANTGIGRATANALAARGDRLILACRSRDKTQPVIDELRRASGNEQIEFLPLDLANLDSVRTAASQFLERGLPLHVLLNNAGLAGRGGISDDGFELMFGVNHLGHFLLTTLLLERLRESGPSRVVNVSSQAHYDARGIDFTALQRRTATMTGMAEYATSKLANVLFTQELARRVPANEVASYALHPGVIGSDVWRDIPWPVSSLIKLFMKSTEDGARTSVYCATAPELAAQSGRYYDDCREKAASRYATEALATELWEHSEEWTLG